MAEDGIELDILGSSCRELTIEASWFNLSPDMDQRAQLLMQKVKPITYEDPPRLAVEYGDVRYEEDGTSVMVQGSLVRFEPEGESASFFAHIALTALDRQPDPPPDRLSPFDGLLEITSECLGESEITYTAVFIYKLDESLLSRIQLPSPLLLATNPGQEFGLTHIESRCTE